MFGLAVPDAALYAIAAFSAAGVILRPFHWPEAVWAVLARRSSSR